jgi:hypothetical protein
MEKPYVEPPRATIMRVGLIIMEELFDPYEKISCDGMIYEPAL